MLRCVQKFVLQDSLKKPRNSEDSKETFFFLNVVEIPDMSATGILLLFSINKLYLLV
jgi:hypothetical protein